MRQLRCALSILLALSTSCLGATKHLSSKDAEEIARLALRTFWGEALDENEKPVQPKNDRDRKTLPIPWADARRVADAGAPAGVAKWAGLDWESYYKAFMRKERSSGRWSSKQIAYIGFLFGVALGSVQKSMQKVPPDVHSRKRAAHELEEAQSSL